MDYNRHELMKGDDFMSVSNKIKALLNLCGKDQGELVSFLGFGSRQSLSNKFGRGSFSAKDLIKIAEFAGYELAFINGNQKIILDKNDIKPVEPARD
jgi:hypothetical protein